MIRHIEATLRESRTNGFIYGTIVQRNERVATKTYSIVTMRSGNQFKQCAVTVNQGQATNESPRGQRIEGAVHRGKRCLVAFTWQVP